MTRKTLDPNLASILDSIRATVGGEEPAPIPWLEADDEPDPDGYFDTLPSSQPGADASADAASTDAGAQAGAAAAAAPKARSGKKSAAVAPAAPAATGVGGRTVEEFLAELIRPQLDAWLKTNLPELIQKMAADEIARLTGRK